MRQQTILRKSQSFPDLQQLFRQPLWSWAGSASHLEFASF
jgi:hypothetical protein